ncbi:hypothetical protein LSH36_1586g00008 [Paralvinella palmiformis]|uniref:Uncharacterized protein n=1 Tax=Paralvinella palmiformis TaxID=53620 RepID=A0AAD9IT98_9ANNE|nr:hypothetical protein LSH36_1586g00008 [Paralvinella palmiformis]
MTSRSSTDPKPCSTITKGYLRTILLAGRRYRILCFSGILEDKNPADRQLVNLDCGCTLNGTSLQLKVFDEPDLKLYSSGQKTILSAYKKDQHGSCKFKFQAVSLGSTAPAQLSAMTFNIGKHPKNRNKFYRSYKMFGPRVLERGVSKKKQKQVVLPYCWTSPDQQTDICIERVGDVIQFRSTTCPYALDVDVGTTPMTGTLFVEKSYSDQLTGMCGNCDNQDNGYHLADGTSVDDEEDMQEIYRLITESYHDTKARSRRSTNH